MKAFPVVVKAFADKHNTTRFKPDDVFDIVTVAGGEIRMAGLRLLPGFTASITYGDPWQFQPALDGCRKPSRYEALLHLLESTEVLLAEKLEDEQEPMDDMGMVRETGATVDSCLTAPMREW